MEKRKHVYVQRPKEYEISGCPCGIPMSTQPENVDMDKWWRCSRKIRYGHEDTAEAAIAAMKEKGRRAMSAYRCDVCGGWHIGHDARAIVRQFRRLSKIRVGLRMRKTGTRDPLA